MRLEILRSFIEKPRPSARQAMTKTLALAGRPFILDAMHCRKKMIYGAHKVNRHLLLQLKANQAGLVQQAKAIAVQTTPLKQHDTVIPSGAHAMRPAISDLLLPSKTSALPGGPPSCV